MRPKGRAKSF